MKRGIGFLLAWFFVLGMLDLLVCSVRESNSEKVSKISINKYGYTEILDYKIGERYLRFERDCKNPADYKLFNALGDTLNPIEVFVEKRGEKTRYILFDSLDYSHYWLLYKFTEKLTYTSYLIDATEKAETINNYDFLEYFNINQSKEALIDEIKDFNEEMSFFIHIKNNTSDCANVYYEFSYNNQDELLVNYFTDDYLPKDNIPSNTFTVDKEILNELEGLSYQLDEKNDNSSTHSVTILSNTIQGYSYNSHYFNLDAILWETINRYIIEQ